ncbi:MAG TPA: hypothetical protein VEH27_06075 [Methylomirabilota bacterium]|nr:hypothetical protein [Methylomirabilota bacterium]
MVKQSFGVTQRIFLFLTLASAMLFVGCKSTDGGPSPLQKFLYDHQVITVPGEVTRTNVVWQTNVVVVSEARTNETTGEVAAPVLKQVITPVVEYDYAPTTYRTNLVPRQSIDDGLQIVGALPIPYAGTATAFLGWLYTAYRARKNKQTNIALLASVQAVRDWLNTTPEGERTDEKVKQILIEQQTVRGAVTEVKRLLDKYVPNH